jgi:hypothetical protein
MYKSFTTQTCPYKNLSLPSEHELTFTGNDWVLVLLDKLDAVMQVKMMFFGGGLGTTETILSLVRGCLGREFL